MKTIAEAAQEFSENIRENSLTGNNIGKEQYKAGRKIGFKAGVEFAEQWISVEDEPTEYPKQYLLKTSPGWVYTAFCVSVTDFRMTCKGYNVTHWRPINRK